MDTSSRPASPRRTRRTAASLLVVLALTGCSVRLETPPPSEPSLTSVEAARRAAVTDVLDVRATAQAATAKAAKRPAAILAEVAAAADSQETQLGGVYASGLVGPDGSPAPAPTGTPAGTDVPATIEVLAQAASRARAGLETAEDPGFARLTGSLSIAHLAAARALAAAADAEQPETEFTPVPAVPAELDGVPASDLLALVVAEDSAGYMLEVLASRLEDPRRAAALSRAAIHRERADDWARVAGVDATPEDPRRVAYALPDGIATDEPRTARVAEAETALTADLVTLLAVVPPQSRAATLDLAADTWSSALTWGASRVPFPGMPELAPATD
ncbi:DUF4439 domain-containing protein [Sanguibacter sp. A247]|uniref:DUF4439 domain-containing protein n=1 Tax=unclassified Sanguibacter TaxID=2645534 RepID=UPI003FD8A594